MRLRLPTPTKKKIGSGSATLVTHSDLQKNRRMLHRIRFRSTVMLTPGLWIRISEFGSRPRLTRIQYVCPHWIRIQGYVINFEILIRTRIHKASEYGSGSTKLPNTDPGPQHWLTHNLSLYVKKYR